MTLLALDYFAISEEDITCFSQKRFGKFFEGKNGEMNVFRTTSLLIDIKNHHRQWRRDGVLTACEGTSIASDAASAVPAAKKPFGPVSLVAAVFNKSEKFDGVDLAASKICGFIM